MAIIIKGTGGLDTPSINATANAVFTGPVDFTQAVLKGVNKWQVVGSDTNLQSNRNYFANTRSASLTLTLPTSANVGDTIVVQDSEGFASSNNITINRNGNLIDGSARNAILNVDRGGIALTFESATNGFVTRKEGTDNTPFFQGTVASYSSGGFAPPSPTAEVNTIDKFFFSNESNTKDVGNLNNTLFASIGQSSDTFGYSSGGYSPPKINNIDKFPFATDSNATDVGDLTQARYGGAGQSSDTSGYASGGDAAPPLTDRIDKFPFASDTNATDIGNLSSGKYYVSGQSSQIAGYTSGGGFPVPTDISVIDKFPFTNDTNATNIGDLSQARRLTSGQSSFINGYASGGSSPDVATIDKFPFATDTNATDVADLTQTSNRGAAGTSSTTNGYVSGGISPPAGIQTNIDRFPFSTDANATSVGDITQARWVIAGQQV